MTFGWGGALIAVYWWVAVSQVLVLGDDAKEFWVLVIALALTILISTYCLYALAHKRLHDLGYPGFYALGALVFSFIFPLAIFLLVGLLAIKNGKLEDNEYGAPPVRTSK